MTIFVVNFQEEHDQTLLSNITYDFAIKCVSLITLILNFDQNGFLHMDIEFLTTKIENFTKIFLFLSPTLHSNNRGANNLLENI